MARTVSQIFKSYRGAGHNMTVAQAVNSPDATIRRSIRAKILLACVENQSQCFFDLWPDLQSYPNAEETWAKIAKAGYAPQALNGEDTALRMFISHYLEG